MRCIYCIKLDDFGKFVPKRPAECSHTRSVYTQPSSLRKGKGRRRLKKKKLVRHGKTLFQVFESTSKVTVMGPNPTTPPVLLTSECEEACLNCGVQPEDLRKRSLNSFAEFGVNPTVQQMRHAAYLHRRQECWKLVQEELEKSQEKQVCFGVVAAISSCTIAVKKTRTQLPVNYRLEDLGAKMFGLQVGNLFTNLSGSPTEQREIETLLQFQLQTNESVYLQNHDFKLKREIKQKLKAESDLKALPGGVKVKTAWEGAANLVKYKTSI